MRLAAAGERHSQSSPTASAPPALLTRAGIWERGYLVLLVAFELGLHRSSEQSVRGRPDRVWRSQGRFFRRKDTEHGAAVGRRALLARMTPWSGRGGTVHRSGTAATATSSTAIHAHCQGKIQTAGPFQHARHFRALLIEDRTEMGGVERDGGLLLCLSLRCSGNDARSQAACQRRALDLKPPRHIGKKRER